MKKIAITLLGILFVVSGCKRDKTMFYTPAKAKQTTQDNKLLQDNFNFLGSTVENEANQDDGSWKMGSFKTDTIIGSTDCVILTYDSIAQTKTLHFGLDSLGNYVNCECNDNLNRRGRIILTFSGNYFDDGVTTTATTDQFFIDDHQLVSTMTILHQASGPNGNPIRMLSVPAAELTASDGSWTMTWWREQDLEMIKGASTIFWPFDNIFEVNEVGGGVNRYGFAYNYETTTPVMVRWDCIYLYVDGVVELTGDNQFIGSLDLDPIGDFDPAGETQPCDLAFSITTGDGEVWKFFY